MGDIGIGDVVRLTAPRLVVGMDGGGRCEPDAAEYTVIAADRARGVAVVFDVWGNVRAVPLSGVTLVRAWAAPPGAFDGSTPPVSTAAGRRESGVPNSGESA